MSAAPAITARTRVFAILGDPVTQSLSPIIHNAAIRAAGLDAVYTALHTSADDFTGLCKALARAGGGGNVTTPHKGLAAAALDRASDLVRQTNACNTFWLENGQIVGDNTDVTGFRKALHEHFGPATGQRVLLLGGGGAARAVVAALAAERCDRIDVQARSQTGIAELRAVTTAVPIAAVQDDARYDLVVNATSLGMRASDALPLSGEQFERAGAVFDLVYANGATPLVRAARAAGLRAFDGTEMLLQQAAAAFECWWSQPAPLAAMREALRR